VIAARNKAQAAVQQAAARPGDPAAMHLIQGMIAGVEGTDFKMVMRPVETSGVASAKV